MENSIATERDNADIYRRARYAASLATITRTHCIIIMTALHKREITKGENKGWSRSTFSTRTGPVARSRSHPGPPRFGRPEIIEPFPAGREILIRELSGKVARIDMAGRCGAERN